MPPSLGVKGRPPLGLSLMAAAPECTPEGFSLRGKQRESYKIEHRGTTPVFEKVGPTREAVAGMAAFAFSP
jgi:hypothetical protein